MGTEEDFNRRTDRIALGLPIQAIGTDSLGQTFREEARTVLVTRHGGKIILARELSLDSELTIRYPRRDREAMVRVLWRSDPLPEGRQYGIEVLDPNENLWGIHFPNAREAAEAVGRVLLECTSCHEQEVACLDGLALELFQANRCISRPCKCSTAMTTWGEVSIVGEAQQGAAGQALSSRGQTTSTRVLLGLDEQAWRIQACIKSGQLDDDLVWTQTPTKDGVRFKSERRYEEKEKVDIALPYQPGGGNVFIPAEIRWSTEDLSAGVFHYGAVYLRRIRKAPRFPAKVMVYVGILGVGLRMTGRIVDLSMTGVLMQSSTALEPGTNVRLGIEMGVDTFRTVAIVRRMVPDAGIAFEFAQMTQRDRQLLGRLIQSMKLSRSS